MTTIKTEQFWSKPNGVIPNSRYPLLVHRLAIPTGIEERVVSRFRENGWLNNWNYPGVYTYRHFHSTTHECLGVARGWMDVEIFGDGGPILRVSVGDVIAMPAGVSHMMVGHSDDVSMVGGYPEGRDWDNMRHEHLREDLRRDAVKRIMMLPIPGRDPATGASMQQWLDAPSSVDADLNSFRDGLEFEDTEP